MRNSKDTYGGEAKGNEGKAWLRTLRAIAELFFGSNRGHSSRFSPRLFCRITASEEQQQHIRLILSPPLNSSTPSPTPDKNLRQFLFPAEAEMSKLWQWSRRNETSPWRLRSLMLKNGVVNPPAELAAIDVRLLLSPLFDLTYWNAISTNLSKNRLKS